MQDPQRFNELAEEDLNLEARYEDETLLKSYLEGLCKRFQEDVLANKYVSKKDEVLFKGKENAEEIRWYSADMRRATAFTEILRGE